jgi:siroheme synthase
MSQSVSFIQFNEKDVSQFWEQCLQSSFSIAITSQVNDLANIVRNIQKGDYSDDMETRRMGNGRLNCLPL